MKISIYYYCKETLMKKIILMIVMMLIGIAAFADVFRIASFSPKFEEAVMMEHEFELERKKQGCPHTATCRNYYAGMCDICVGENMLDEEK